MDIVFISDLRVEAIIGIYDWERTTPQTIAIDLQMATDIRQAAATEQIQHALNYKEISERLESFIANSQFQLVETLAEKLCEILLNEYAIPWVRLTLHKPQALADSTDVGVIIERGSKD